MSNNSHRLKVAWSIQDVKSLRPKWTDQKCEEILYSAWSDLEDQAIRSGWEVLEEAIFQEEL